MKVKVPPREWIKICSIKKSVKFYNYPEKHYFMHVANVKLDNDKKRNTMIRFEPVLEKDVFARKTEWIYLLTINDKIVKIGGTRTGLKGRVNSYLCGHHIKERNKSGHCSRTNGFVYNTLLFYLLRGYKIKMYGYELPENILKVNAFGSFIEISTQTFHAYESLLLNRFKDVYGYYPELSDNCDPKYKS